MNATPAPGDPATPAQPPTAAARGRLHAALGRVAAADWSRPAVQVLVVLGVCLAVGLRNGAATGAGRHLWVDWASAFATYWPLLVAGLVGLGGRRWWRVAWWLVAGLTVAGVVWHLVSNELVLAQGRKLLLPELLRQFDDPVERRFALSILVDPWTLLTVGLLLAGLIGLPRLVPVRGRRVALGVWLVPVILAGLIHSAWHIHTVRHPDAETYAGHRTGWAPWTPQLYRETTAVVSVATSRAVAQRLRRDPDGDPLWLPGPDAELAPLAGRYRGRSVLIVVLESHRLSEVDGFGAGAHGHTPSSPRLAAAAADGLWFANTFGNGLATRTMEWSLVTGLPTHPWFHPATFSPELAVESAAHDFARAGYAVEWMQATPTTFCDNHRTLAAAGFDDRLKPSEVARGPAGNLWGMADEDLFDHVAARLADHAAAGRPCLLVTASISNHVPHSFTKSTRHPGLTPDLAGGMRYADACLGDLLDQIRLIPADRRPLVWITADHTLRLGLNDARPIGPSGMEGWRIPGLLLLPDGQDAGRVVTTPMSHIDVLDLMGLLCLDGPRVAEWKFTRRHRLAVPVDDGEYTFIGRDALVLSHGAKAWRITGPWTLAEDDGTAGIAAIRDAGARFRQTIDALWQPWPRPTAPILPPGPAMAPDADRPTP